MNFKQLFSVILLVLAGFFAKADSDTTTIQLQSVNIVPNTISGFSLNVNFNLGLTGQIVDPDYYLQYQDQMPKFEITYEGVKKGTSCLGSKPLVARTSFGVQLTGFSENDMKYFFAKDNQISILCASDFTIRYYSASVARPTAADYKICKISAENVNNLIRESATINDTDRSSFITSINNYYYFENKIDAGVDPASIGKIPTFIMTARLQNRFGKPKFLSCNNISKNSSLMPSVYWSLDTRLSTNFGDSLNYVNFSPLNVRKAWKNYTRELNLKLSNQSDQTFTTKSAAMTFSFRAIVPNFVNLTTATDNRLRLKPIIDIGAKGYYDYSNGVTAYGSGQVFGKLYYYIPVYNNYSIIINGTAFYDMATERNPDQKLSTNYSITIASEIGTSGYKAIVKYENGKSDISQKEGQAVVLGLLMDFLKEKKIPMLNN